MYRISFKNTCCGTILAPSAAMFVNLAASLKMKDLVNDPSGLGSGQSKLARSIKLLD